MYGRLKMGRHRRDAVRLLHRRPQILQWRNLAMYQLLLIFYCVPNKVTDYSERIVNSASLIIITEHNLPVLLEAHRSKLVADLLLILHD